MSIRLPPSAALDPRATANEDTSFQSDDDDDDQNWDDWVSDSGKQTCQSLFDDKVLSSAEKALEYDKSQHGFDLGAICSKLSLDSHGRIRLINWIRKNRALVNEVVAFTGSEEFLTDDEYLIPVVPDDPLLQVLDGDWSDSDEVDTRNEESMTPADRNAFLAKQLAKAKKDLEDYRAFVGERLDISRLDEDVKEGSLGGPSTRDDDSHYFKSYAENDIHAVMIQDKVRTATYASFILRNPRLFEDAVVLDVGCGTGILSLFAAKSGAKRVFAVDASDIAEKAEIIVKTNNLENVITVIRGKVEDIKLPKEYTQVDVIISEWMGYALLYESMLDSVLSARDRFLKPEGVLAPSECRMMLALCEGSELFKERIEFWNDIYGFDLSTMASDVYNEAVVDVVGSEAVIGEPCLIKDIYLGEISARQLDFIAPFTLIPASDRRTKIHAFVLYFDAFFSPSGSRIPEHTEVNVIKDDDLVIAEVWPLGGKPNPRRRSSQGAGLKGKENITSFSTGPRSIPTHWKQTVFFLKEPFTVDDSTIVSGTFHCRKSEKNSRELDVEIHYSIKENADAPAPEVVVQYFKIR